MGASRHAGRQQIAMASPIAVPGRTGRRCRRPAADRQGCHRRQTPLAGCHPDADFGRTSGCLARWHIYPSRREQPAARVASERLMTHPQQPTTEHPKRRSRLVLSGLLLATLLVGGAAGVAVSSLTGGDDTDGAQASSASEPTATASDNTSADPTPPAPDVADLEFPDETTTGVPEGVELTETGSLTVTEDGATVDAMLIRGNVKVEADDVTITNSKIVNDSIYAIQDRKSVV